MNENGCRQTLHHQQLVIWLHHIAVFKAAGLWLLIFD
jgi:hypothetical protein